MTFKSTIAASLVLAPAFFAHAQTALPAASTYAVTQRQSVAVSAVEHAHLLTEMNDFLNAVHAINVALSTKDFATVTALATAMGPKGGKHDAVGKAVHEKLPQAWFDLAKPTHQHFLGVAKEASSPGATVEGVVAKLATTTQQCVACHATFKLTVTP
jgi:cytochrome c556